MEHTVSASKIKVRWWLTFLIEDLPVGTTFGAEALHLTVLPWFVTDAVSELEILRTFTQTFRDVVPQEIITGQIEELGEREVPVNLVEPVDQLTIIHERALVWFSDIGGRWALKNPYVGEDYRPHIRRRAGTTLRSGDKLTLTNLSLIRASRTEDRMRQVAARIEF
jgi:hypothetical protein